MRFTMKMWLRSAACVVTLSTTALVCTGCEVEAEPGPGYPAAYPAGYYDEYPPDAYIATTEPVYFEGNAAYWYGNHWYYRSGGRWNHYDHEPAGLYQRRMQGGGLGRRQYESHGGGGGRGGGRGGRR